MARFPNGLITVLLKRNWPGLYNPTDDPDHEGRVLALSWMDYQAAKHAEFGTHANAVITKFWVSFI